MVTPVCHRRPALSLYVRVFTYVAEGVVRNTGDDSLKERSREQRIPVNMQKPGGTAMLMHLCLQNFGLHTDSV